MIHFFSNIKNCLISVINRKAIKQQQSEYIKCQNSAEYFIKKYCVLDIHSNKTFDLYEWQKKALDIFKTKKLILVEQHELQQGASSLLAAFALHQLLFRTPRKYKDIFKICIFSRSSENACNILTIIENMYEKLPVFLKGKNEQKTRTIFSITTNNDTTASILSHTNNTTYIKGRTFDITLIDDISTYNNIQHFLEDVAISSYKTVIFTGMIIIPEDTYKLIEYHKYNSTDINSKIGYLLIDNKMTF